jgi:hypothetical protein
MPKCVINKIVTVNMMRPIVDAGDHVDAGPLRWALTFTKYNGLVGWGCTTH